MLIKRHQQLVWVHTERDAPRQRHPYQGPRHRPDTSAPPHPAPGSLRVIQAKRPLQTELGRCLAIRLLDRPAGPCLQILVASPHRSTTWFDVEKALTPRQANAWARLGF